MNELIDLWQVAVEWGASILDIPWIASAVVVSIAGWHGLKIAMRTLLGLTGLGLSRRPVVVAGVGADARCAPAAAPASVFADVGRLITVLLVAGALYGGVQLWRWHQGTEAEWESAVQRVESLTGGRVHDIGFVSGGEPEGLHVWLDVDGDGEADHVVGPENWR